MQNASRYLSTHPLHTVGKDSKYKAGGVCVRVFMCACACERVCACVTCVQALEGDV